MPVLQRVVLVVFVVVFLRFHGHVEPCSSRHLDHSGAGGDVVSVPLLQTPSPQLRFRWRRYRKRGWLESNDRFKEGRSKMHCDCF